MADAGFVADAFVVGGFAFSAIMLGGAVAGLLFGPRLATTLSHRPVHRLRTWAFGMTMLSAGVAAQAYRVLHDGNSWINGADVLLMGLGLVVTFRSGLEPVERRAVEGVHDMPTHRPT